jgi:small GTP-binding protein
MAFPSLLNPSQTKIWQSEKHQIEQLIELITSWEISPEDLEHLQRTLEQLHELFLLVVVGEFNSGKTALINALLGQRYLKEGVTPTTDRIHIIRHGVEGPPEFAGDDVRILRYPVDFLQEINIVDTPGTNAVLRRHEAISRHFVPRSDLVLFVTSADRPFTESERDFLEHIRQWGKKVVVLINKSDILDDAQAKQEVEDFVQDQVKRLLGLEPDTFMVSAKQALDGGEASGFKEFQSFLFDTLNQDTRIQLKLASPLGVAQNLAAKYRQLAADRLDVLQGDVSALEKVERHIDLYEDDTRAEFERRLTGIENELLEMRIRGEVFLDDRMRLLNLREMLQGNKLRKAFEAEVIGETPARIEKQVQEVIDWLVERDLRQWRLVADELGNRGESGSLKQAAQEAAGGFNYNRRQLLDSIGAQADRVISSYDSKAESARLATTVQDSVAMVGLVEVGAVGLGLILKAILVSATADATGILAAGVLGVFGLAIIPLRRGQAKRDLRTKMDELRSKLRAALDNSFDTEVQRSITRLREALSPYRRFVMDEQEQLEAIDYGLDEIQEELKRLESVIDSDD